MSVELQQLAVLCGTSQTIEVSFKWGYKFNFRFFFVSIFNVFLVAAIIHKTDPETDS